MIFLVYTGAWIRQIKYIVMMTKEGCTKIVNYMALGAGVLILGSVHISQYIEYASSSTISIYNTLIAIVLRDYNVDFVRIC